MKANSPWAKSDPLKLAWVQNDVVSNLGGTNVPHHLQHAITRIHNHCVLPGDRDQVMAWAMSKYLADADREYYEFCAAWVKCSEL